MVKAADRDPVDQLFDTDGLLGWSGTLRGNVVQAVVSGGHYAFMREPLVLYRGLPNLKSIRLLTHS